MPRRLSPQLLLSVIGTLALVVFAGCLGDPSLTPKKNRAPLAAEPTFVGNAACAECHPTVSGEHAQSNHALTLSLLSSPEADTRQPPLGKIARSEFVLEKQSTGAGRIVSLPGMSEEKVALELAVGSGKTGITYVSFLEDNKMAEFRMSYFPLKKLWYVTPGQEKLALGSLGKVHSAPNAKKCMLCHAVTVPEAGRAPEKRFFGVGCESCHGSGAAHVAAARAGKLETEGKMERLGKLSARELNRRCGQCHGTPESVIEAGLPPDVTNRMQTYGLMESACYKKSGEALSCLTCHSPHQNARTEPRFYERTCLSCHSSASPSQKPCPVSPKEKCIGCHMPQRKALAGSEIPMTMADHKIHIPRKN